MTAMAEADVINAAFEGAVAPLLSVYEQLRAENAETLARAQAREDLLTRRIAEAKRLLLENGRDELPERIEDIAWIESGYDPGDDRWPMLAELLDLMRRLGYSSAKVAAVRDLV